MQILVLVSKRLFHWQKHKRLLSWLVEGTLYKLILLIHCYNANLVSEKNGLDARERILKESADIKPENIVALNLDLSSFASIHSFAAAVTEKFSSIDVLVNNAGIMALPTRQVIYFFLLSA